MPEILVISGKGGTGKTSLTAAFAHLASEPILGDLDVDAPDLHLVLAPEIRKTEEFFSGNEALIDPGLCDGCGICRQMCRFGGVKEEKGVFSIDPLGCEGCKVCVAFCPQKAVSFPERHCGQWFISETRFGPMAHARLFPGQENSGKLVSLLKTKARELAREKGRDLVLLDGPPGIGCPVIASLSGTDLVVAVTEPTPSGRHDLLRLLDLCEHFRLPAGVIVNKCDLNEELARDILKTCEERGVALLPGIRHDLAVTEAMVKGLAVTEHTQNGPAKALRRAWDEILALAAEAAKKKQR